MEANMWHMVLRAAITLCAIGFIWAHLVFPNIQIDQITVTLFIVAIVPWLSSIFKSLEFPGGGKLEFQQFKEKVDPIIAKASEPAPQSAGSASRLKSFVLDPRRDGLVLKALADPKYTWRYLGGLKESSGLSESDVLAAINWFKANDLVAETKGRGGRLWALTPEGIELHDAVLKLKDASGT
jgi:hypothetical protein